jgi:hypothetical protein
MIELSTRTKASYTYVKDWMMIRECVAGVLGSLQSTSHQNVKLNLKLPEGTNARFVKISGALQVTKRASGRDAEATLGDLRFGDRRDVLVQLVIAGDEDAKQDAPKDAWESIVSGLEALGGPLDADDDARPLSVEELPLLQADLTFGDILREGQISHPPRPSLLAITMLPPATSLLSNRSSSAIESGAGAPPIPPNKDLVQRRMELLTSDMLTRALTLIGRGHNERAANLLRETKTILRSLGTGVMPPVPATDGISSPVPPEIDGDADGIVGSPSGSTANLAGSKTKESPDPSPLTAALEAEVESALEWISHPAIFSRDCRKAVFQAIGIIASQRAYTMRSNLETLFAEKIPGVREMARKGREWREIEETESGVGEGMEEE